MKIEVVEIFSRSGSKNIFTEAEAEAELFILLEAEAEAKLFILPVEGAEAGKAFHFAGSGSKRKFTASTSMLFKEAILS